MNPRASSFHAEATPWYRERWPWLLTAGPLAVVLGCLASAWMAASSDDGVVAQDYYKQGLLINRKLRTAPVVEPAPDARLSVEEHRIVRIRLGEGRAPARLLLTLTPVHDRVRARHVELARSGEDWVGALPDVAPGRWLVALESDAWRVPVTIVSAPFTELHLRGEPGRS